MVTFGKGVYFKACHVITSLPVCIYFIADVSKCNCIIVLCSTLQMLTNIENRLEELFEQIEMMPQDKVEAAEKVRLLEIIPFKFLIKMSSQKRADNPSKFRPYIG